MVFRIPLRKTVFARLLDRENGLRAPLLAGVRGLALFALGSPLAAQVADPTAAAATVTPQPTDLVVLPFANNTGTFAAYERILPRLYEALDARGVGYVRHDDIRPLLRRHRVRTIGQVGRDDALLLREELEARYLLLGSLDLFTPGQSLEIAISARLLDLRTLELVAIWSAGGTVQETEGLFGAGRAESVDEVIGPVVDDLVGSLLGRLRGAPDPESADHTCDLVAIVPLNDHTDRRNAAEVIQNVLMVELDAQGYTVVEPGFVTEILLDHQTIARGGVSDAVLAILREELEVCWVVTGDLEEFEPTLGGGAMAVPRLDLGLRLVDARTPRLVAALNLSRSGLDGEGLLQLGREHSMIRLARGCLRDAVDWIDREGDGR